MSLPAAVDIALGLIFIYLTLSLLTSEIQELVAIALQWRAEHLKKSIETLLAGNWQSARTQHFVDQFYQSPFIQALNQEGRGGLEKLGRTLIRSLLRLYDFLTRTTRVLGTQNSAPSYIPAETFAVALIQHLQLQRLSQKIGHLTARSAVELKLARLTELLKDLRNCLGDPTALSRELLDLQQSLEATLAEFEAGRATLTSTLSQLTAQLTQFIDHTEAQLSQHNYREALIRRRLPYLRQIMAQPQVEPTLSEIVQSLLVATQLPSSNPDCPSALPEDAAQPAFAPEPAQLPQSQLPQPSIDPFRAVMQTLQEQHPEWLEPVSQMPPALQQNLSDLAEQSRLKASGLENQLRQLEQEIAAWFNRAMDRASGVYRRNAKGVALLIGFLTAIAINADTFHMVDWLSRDSLWRTSISQAAGQIAVQNPTPAPTPAAAPGNLQPVKAAINPAWDDLPLPFGWDAANRQSSAPAPQGLLFWGKRLLGWLITGVALSMGAAFWYDLLQKVMQVRGTGKKPDED